ncbi:MAG: 30S ribosome-binding factor RbfA [Candidatus Omnitrophica bacterium]|nr:30S ribosome-binding factor RbfA [Candidatus Omnitrophota bacterium]
MQGKRVERVAELIRGELARTIVGQLRDPRVGFVTITHVEVSADLHYAKVHCSVLGDDETRKRTQEALTHAKGFLQKDLARVLNLRYTPQLEFFLDPSVDHSLEIDGILRELHKKDSPESPEKE